MSTNLEQLTEEEKKKILLMADEIRNKAKPQGAGVNLRKANPRIVRQIIREVGIREDETESLLWEARIIMDSRRISTHRPRIAQYTFDEPSDEELEPISPKDVDEIASKLKLSEVKNQN